jgi:hypothetical protein
MTPEQHEFWESLRFDPVWIAHHWGQRLTKLSELEVNQALVPVIEQLLAQADEPTICSVLKTWLTTYHLPLSPQSLGEVFDRVHDRIGARVMANPRSIQAL